MKKAMAGKRKPKRKIEKSDIGNLTSDHLPMIFDTWTEYNDRVLWLLHHHGEDKEIEENRDKATIYYEVWLDLVISLKKRKT